MRTCFHVGPMGVPKHGGECSHEKTWVHMWECEFLMHSWMPHRCHIIISSHGCHKCLWTWGSCNKSDPKVECFWGAKKAPHPKPYIYTWKPHPRTPTPQITNLFSKGYLCTFMCPNSPPNLEIVWNNNKMQKMIEKVSIKSKNTISMVFFTIYCDNSLILN